MRSIYHADTILKPGVERPALADLFRDRIISCWELDKIIIDLWRCQQIEHTMNCPRFPIYIQTTCGPYLTHFEIVSALCWKHSCSQWLDSTRCAKCRKIASCSSADTYQVSLSPPSFLSTSKSFFFFFGSISVRLGERCPM